MTELARLVAISMRMSGSRQMCIAKGSPSCTTKTNETGNSDMDCSFERVKRVCNLFLQGQNEGHALGGPDSEDYHAFLACERVEAGQRRRRTTRHECLKVFGKVLELDSGFVSSSHVISSSIGMYRSWNLVVSFEDKKQAPQMGSQGMMQQQLGLQWQQGTTQPTLHGRQSRGHTQVVKQSIMVVQKSVICRSSLGWSSVRVGEAPPVSRVARRTCTNSLQRWIFYRYQVNP